jgi:hypothetical protein
LPGQEGHGILKNPSNSHGKFVLELLALPDRTVQTYSLVINCTDCLGPYYVTVSHYPDISEAPTVRNNQTNRKVMKWCMYCTLLG